MATITPVIIAVPAASVTPPAVTTASTATSAAASASNAPGSNATPTTPTGNAAAITPASSVGSVGSGGGGGGSGSGSGGTGSGTGTTTTTDVEEINTKELAQRISAELKRYSIPQAIFAQRVLCRSQGTLSDLLRNPKPWSKLKSGRETFRRMFKWLQEPEFQRMSALRMAGECVFWSALLSAWVGLFWLITGVPMLRLCGWLGGIVYEFFLFCML